MRRARRGHGGMGIPGAVLSLIAACLPAAAGAQEESAAGPVTLEAAVRSAVATHPSLEAARARLAAAEAGVGEARASWLPTVGARALATRYEEPMVVAPLHGFDPSSPPAFERTLIQGHAVAEWTAFDGGARGARMESARAVESAAAAGLEAAEAVVIAEAVSAYVAASTAGALVAAHEQLVAALERERDRSRQLFEQGSVAEVAVLRAGAALARSRAELESARQGSSVAIHRLARVTGIPAVRLEARGLTPVVAAGAAWEPARASLIARALEANPEIERARSRAAAAESLVSAASAGWLPRIGVVGQYSAYGSTDSSLQPEWNAGVQLSWAAFTGGARSRAVDRARAEATAAWSDAALVAREVEGAVDRALASYGSARARVAALEAAAAQSAEVARIEALALDAGAGVQAEYLRAEAELLETRALLAEARGVVVEALVRLALATGSLTPATVMELTDEVAR